MSLTISHLHVCLVCGDEFECPRMFCMNSYYNGRCKRCDPEKTRLRRL